ncbi:myristylprotein [Tanapox virus]|uniref:Myristylprotein n=1 Tax=Tanapox virus TaxID=99000 RepID=A7XCR5_9POXV|nr:myristylprotein [Tanapox virus]ABQ43760.1 myristylprotein [Tanapox virus]
MNLEHDIINILINTHGKSDFLFTDNEISFKYFSNLCKDFLINKKTTTLIEIKKILMEIPNSMISQVWAPIANFCDCVTYYNCSNEKWANDQLEMVLRCNSNMFNKTSYGNLARIAISYPFDCKGRKSINIINKYLFGI